MDWIVHHVGLAVGYPNILSRQRDPKSYDLTQEEEEWVRMEIQRLTDANAIKFLGSGPSRPEQLLCASPIFLVPKPGPKRYCLVVDMRRLNLRLEPHPFKMEGMGSVLRSTGRGWWFITIDLVEGYHHVQMSEFAQRFLGFRISDKWYQFRVLPFGLCQAVWIFCKIMHALIARWRRIGITCGNHVDDIYVAHPSRETLLRIRDEVIAVDIFGAGFVRSTVKGSWEPTQTPVFKGLIIDTVRAEIRVPEDKLKSALPLLRTVASATQLPARQLAQAAGKLMSFSSAFAPAKAYSVEFFSLIDALHRKPWEWDRSVLITPRLQADARWLMENLLTLNGRPAWKPSRLRVLFVDASTTGWGATFEGRTAAGSWARRIPARWITQAEAQTVLLGLESFADLLRHNWVSVHIDNVGAQFTVVKGGRQDWQKDIMRRIHDFCWRNDIWLFNTVHVPSELNPADDPSRQIDTADWRVAPEIFHYLDRLFGPHTIDRMADRRNAQLPRFNSRWYCPGSEAVDCFTQDWAGETNWVVPPFCLIHRVLQHIRECGAIATVVLPRWDGQPWWPMVLNQVNRQVELPPAEEVFLEGPAGAQFLEPLHNRAWRFLAVQFRPESI